VKGQLRFNEPEREESIPSCDLVAEWEKQLRQYQLRVRLGETVTDIQKTDKFRVLTDQRTYVCDWVILCVGKLVYLTKLDIGREAEPKVFYEPPEAEKYQDRDILVVGSTNEALETALGLSNANRATLVHSDPELTDAEPTVVEAVQARVRAGKLNVLSKARVKRVERDSVVVETPSAPALRLNNDVVFPFLGIEKTELPLDFARSTWLTSATGTSSVTSCLC